MGKSQRLYEQARKFIPGGTQLLSKRPEMFLPNFWPAYYKKAKGCLVWDLDDRKYIDMSYMGLGACTIGYADKDVDDAVESVIKKGNMCTLNAPEEVELGKTLLGIHTWSAMIRYARSGGEAMAIAVRLARAFSGRDKILFCGYHGWHDWYLAANLSSNEALDGHLLPGLEPKGVPRALLGTAIPFLYNDIRDFKDKFIRYKKEIGAVVMEPLRNFYPKEGFLEEIRSLTIKSNIPLIFDEVSSGFRIHLGGAHLQFHVNPDMAVFAKGMSNGYPMAAIIGVRGLMDVAQKTFVSSTYWTDRIGPSASLATIDKFQRENVVEHLQTIGKMVQDGWRAVAEKYDLKVSIQGMYPMSHFTFNYKNSLAVKTLFTQLMLERGFLATTAFYASYAHKQKHLDHYFQTIDEVFKILKQLIESGEVEKKLRGPIAHSSFRRLA